MKNHLIKVITWGVFSLGASSFGHGAIAQQASEAVAVATKMFLSAQPKEVTRQFASVTADLAGIEQFDVTIRLQDQKTTFHFDCRENEDVKPVVWECE